MNHFSHIKIGVLGGGQLGKMLYQEATKLGIQLYYLEKDDKFPTTQICKQFKSGDFKNYDDVLNFGKEMDVITIEIEAVNTDALRELEKLGKKVFPQASVIELIKDKGDQKEFYVLNDIPTSPFFTAESKENILEGIEDGTIQYPFVQKARRDGYDGKGVAVINNENDLSNLMDTPSIIEDKIAIDKEISVIACRDQEGKTTTFPIVEMEFHPTANLVEFLKSPTNLSAALQEEAENIALQIIEGMGLIGILAIEMFVTKDGEILVNEVAPRPHNSGHQTIEANYTSQYGQLIRILSGLPLGNTDTICPSVMINILGDQGHTGPAVYDGLEKALSTPGVYVHLYGKETTKPYRKMGHATILAPNLETAIERANFVKSNLNVIT